MQTNRKSHPLQIPPRPAPTPPSGVGHGIRPVTVLATIMWTLFISLGLGMVFGRVDTSLFNVIFLGVCFLVAAFTGLASGSTPKAQ